MKSIALDLWKPYHAPIEVVQREAGARTLAFQITDGGVALDLSDKVVTFYATKPDDSIVFNACTVTGVGKCTYLLTAQTCAVVGDLSCTLVITGTGYEARTQPFTVTVIASPDYTSAVESTDEFTALSALAGDIASNTGRLDGIIDLIYPVGSIYISTVATNPGTLFGGTWTAFGAGKTLVGIDSGDTAFDTVEETGGEKAHTLTVAEMPAHTHPVSISALTITGSGSAEWNCIEGGKVGGMGTGKINENLAEEHRQATTRGGGGAHNNLQPYIVTYMWKRTA